MIDGKTREIIERAMSDRSVYDAMAARESEVWGKVLPARDSSAESKEDVDAGIQLNAGRYESSLPRVASEKSLAFSRGLSLGCGAGRLERSLLKAGICQSFHAIDVSEEAVNAARKLAAEENLPITYEVADLNFVKLPPKAFDLVAAQTVLHHVLFLEHVAEQVHISLRDSGYLWIHDFIGESQGQYEEKRLLLVNEILSFLPQEFRRNKINGKVVPELKRATPGQLASPFESIRSGEIIEVFERWFAIEWKAEFNALLQFIAPPGTKHAYVKNEDTKALYATLNLLDHICIEEGILTPCGGQYLMRPKAKTAQES